MVGSNRIWLLAYDDMFLLAKNKVGMEEMLSTTKSFLRSRDMILSIEKTKLLINGGRKKGKGKLKRGKENRGSSKFLIFRFYI